MEGQRIIQEPVRLQDKREQIVLVEASSSKDVAVAIQFLHSGRALVTRPEVDIEEATYWLAPRRRHLGQIQVETFNSMTRADFEQALLFKQVAVLRFGWIGEPVDITPEGIARAWGYLRSASFSRRLRSWSGAGITAETVPR